MDIEYVDIVTGDLFRQLWLLLVIPFLLGQGIGWGKVIRGGGMEGIVVLASY